jgi:iron(III) transport system permease protein
MLTAVVAAAASVFVGLGPAVLLARRSASSGLWWLAVLIPLAIPAPLVGIGLVALWNRTMMIDAYGTSLMLVLAALARFVPIATIVFVAQLRRIQPLLFDAARVFQVGRAQGMVRVWLPLVAPGLVAGACFTFALVLGELGATIIVAPPGQATLAIRIYNLLHYGATELIAGLCLFVLFVCLAAVVLALAVLGGAGRGLFSLTREWGVGT